MKKQKFIRTLPNNYSQTTDRLQRALDEGYIVVMCNSTYLENNKPCLEYIVEKDVKEYE